MNTATAYFAQLSNLQLLDIQGPDCAKFLQGQVTCDVRKLQQRASLGAHCTPKGRCRFTFLALRSEDDRITLQVPRAQADTACQSLGKYIVFSKAEIQPSEHQVIAIWGAQAARQIQKAFNQTLEHDNQFVQFDLGTLIRTDAEHYEIWCNAEQLAALIPKLQASAQQATEQHWQLEQIRRGIGHIYPANTDELTPQQLNYQVIGGISFNKGCYTGQEVVARIHYLGKQKSHMQRLSFSCQGPAPEPGTRLITPTGTQSVGRIIFAAKSSDTQAEALAAVSDSGLAGGELLIDSPQQPSAIPLPLPYAITDNEG